MLFIPFAILSSAQYKLFHCMHGFLQLFIKIIMGSCKFPKFKFLFFIMVFYMVYGENAPQIIHDRVALLAFKAGIVVDPMNTLEGWNSSDNVHVCNWVGVKCNGRGDGIVELVLNYSLEGTISPSLSNITYLEVLDLSKNYFRGQIPPEIGSLQFLWNLSLSSNLLEGNIPIQLSSLANLQYLNLGSNNLTGEIPMPLLCNLSALKHLDLSNNSLSGKIPLYKECELRELRHLLLWSNYFNGEVPSALSNSSMLEWLELDMNSLSGELPLNIWNKLPNLKVLYLSYNNFTSHTGNTDLKPFFASLVNASSLRELDLAANHFGGVLPSVIGDLSPNLLMIDLFDNRIFGPIPSEISKLFNLTLLNLSNNFLNGSIPAALCKMERLERLYLSNNMLSGSIPSEFGNLVHLGLLDLSKNILSGTIPDSFANLSQLRKLLLYNNCLSGPIPGSLGKCITLEILDLSNNRLSGTIPNEVAGLRSLSMYMNLSCNQLEGPIPLKLSKMDMVLQIDLSNNHLSGTIPAQLESCIALEYLDLSNNALEGNLPASIGRLPYLKGLDVSFNKLSGDIPQSFQASTSLVKLNFSNNSFSGIVTNEGAFVFITDTAFVGNPGLCGGVKGLPTCHTKNVRHFALVMLISLITIAIIIILVYPVKRKLRVRRRFTNSESGAHELDEETERREYKYPRITYQQLIEATDGFSDSNLIGSGRFGHVYKGVLQDNARIAVKVLTPKTAGEFSGSFERECEVLKRTRHRNLIRIITICSKPDFKAIVLPLMSKGSLEDNLYPSHGLRNGLDLIQLVNICSDVAEGMAYLHHHAPVKVAHCDLKPSNILLDDDMTALVTDFGISRLIKGATEDNSMDDSASYTSTDGLLRGSIGYIPPEYAMGKRASIEGDVFSYGILILEIITGKRPTDVLVGDGSSLHEWVKSCYPHNLELIIEEAMARCTPSCPGIYNGKRWRDVIIEFIELGLICTQYRPSIRPTMMDVAHDIARLKDYLSSSSSLEDDSI